MLFEEILSRIDTTGRRGYVSFETFVLNLLKHHIEDQKKPFTIIEGKIIGDAIAEKGFDDFDGNTIFEVKLYLDASRARLFTDEVNWRFSRHKNLNAFRNLIIITSRSIPKTESLKIIESLSPLFNANVVIWGPDEINRIVIKHKKQAIIIANSLFHLRLENTVNKDTGDWEEARIEILQSISECYRKGQFSLFLGAGVSSSAGMPDWNTLLNSLFVSYLTNEFTDDTNVSDADIKQIVERLNELDEPSALMAARYLRKGLSKEIVEIKEFTKTITNNLYNLRDKTKKIDSTLIRTIAGLCMPKRTGAKVKSVVTYNFDDLLEMQLIKSSIQHHSIYTENESYDPDELPVYHVHGFLPEDPSKYESLEKSTLVFSEEGYHQIYSDPYHWSNLVQLTNLRENNCIMIGLSMTDPNLRRLLDISARNIERPRHFAFMRRMTIDDFANVKDDKGNTKQAIRNIKGAEQFLNSHHKLNEEIMKELGVSIIWFNSFDEIPTILNKIME